MILATSSGENTELQKFNPLSMKSPFLCAIVGKKWAGKTSLILDLLTQICEISESCERYSDIFYFTTRDHQWQIERQFETKKPKNFVPIIIEKEDKNDQDDKLEKILQEICNAQNAHDVCNNAKEILIIFDDVYFSKEILKREFISTLFMEAKRNKISIICGAQWFGGVPSIMRDNADYMFMFQETNSKNLQTLA